MKIGKKEFRTEERLLKQSELNFYIENPRIYSDFDFETSTPTQEEIEDNLINQDHVKKLKLSIEQFGGLANPIIVKEDGLVVLEGNSRLAAYRLLAKKDPVKWGKIKCQVITDEIDESSIFALLGAIHLVGTKDWDPYEQAHYLYRRLEQTRYPLTTLAKEAGIPESKAKSMIHNITLMKQHGDDKKEHYSHYDELTKCSGLKKYRDTTDIDDVICEQIKNGDIIAQDIRKLGKVASLKNDKQSQKIMKQYIGKEIDLETAYSRVEQTGKLDNVVKKLSDFKTFINDVEKLKKQMNDSTEVEEKAKFELKKIFGQLKKLKDELNF